MYFSNLTMRGNWLELFIITAMRTSNSTWLEFVLIGEIQVSNIGPDTGYYDWRFLIPAREYVDNSSTLQVCENCLPGYIQPIIYKHATWKAGGMILRRILGKLFMRMGGDEAASGPQPVSLSGFSWSVVALYGISYTDHLWIGIGVHKVSGYGLEGWSLIPCRSRNFCSIHHVYIDFRT
jgi:hypothetical protein